MPQPRTPRIASLSRRVRPAMPSCRGGASSVLRLVPTTGRLPSAPALGDWLSHAASVLLPVTGPLAMAWEA